MASKEKNMLGKIGSSDFYDFHKIPATKLLKTEITHQRSITQWQRSTNQRDRSRKQPCPAMRPVVLPTASEALSSDEEVTTSRNAARRKGYLVHIDVRGEIEKMSEFRELGLERATENSIGERVNEFGLMEEDKKIIEAKSVKKKTFSRYRNDPSLVKKQYEAQVQFQLGLVRGMQSF